MLAAEVLDCLDALHKKNILHRDIKEENILIDSFFHAVVADYGLAVQFLDATNDTPDNVNLATSIEAALARAHCNDRVCGTPAYMAPELVRGKPYSYPIDLYALGVVLYACLVGSVGSHHLIVHASRLSICWRSYLLKGMIITRQ